MADIGEKNSKKKKEKREREGERTCGARWLSCTFFENDVDTKKKRKRRMPCHGASLLIALYNTHTHTHNVRFTIPNRRRQGRLQSCRQEATTIYRRFGEDFPRQRYALEKQRKRLIIESHERIPEKVDNKRRFCVISSAFLMVFSESNFGFLPPMFVF